MRRFRLLALLLGCVVGLLIVEGLLHTFDWKPTALRTKRQLYDYADPSVYYECYPSNPDGEFREFGDLGGGTWFLKSIGIPPEQLALSRLAETPYCVEYRKSLQNIRDRYYGPGTPGLTRIVGIGDSFAYGEGVPLDASLYKQVEGLLGPRYEVVNAAVPGADTEREIEDLEAACRILDASRAIVTYVLNDIAAEEDLASRQRYINDLILVRDEELDEHRRGSWTSRMPRFVQLLTSRLELRRIERETIEWYHDLYDEQHNPYGLRTLAEQFHRLAGQDRCRVALVIYPLLERAGGTYPFHAAHETVSRLARDAGLPVLDLAPRFADSDPRDLRVHPGDHHPNRAAHGIAAAAIVEWLEAEVPGFL